jgi:hypothetical protein
MELDLLVIKWDGITPLTREVSSVRLTHHLSRYLTLTDW